MPVETRHDVSLEIVGPALRRTLVYGKCLQWHGIEVKLCQDGRVHAGYQWTRCVAIILRGGGGGGEGYKRSGGRERKAMKKSCCAKVCTSV